MNYINYEWVAFILLFPVSVIVGCISANWMNKNRASHFPSIPLKKQKKKKKIKQSIEPDPDEPPLP
jgi:hypothetical protein